MNILIIGNGFDLAHDLKTSYKDFLSCDYCNKITLEEITSGEPLEKKQFRENNLWLKHFKAKQHELGDTWIDLEAEIYEVINKIKNIPATNRNSVSPKSCPLIFSVSKHDKHFSLYRINDYIGQPNYEPEVGERDYAKEIYKENNDIFYVYVRTPKGFVNFLYDQLREFTKAFQQYLIQDVRLKLSNQSKYQLSLRAVGVPQGSNNVKVLSFNYTDTCECLYNQKFNTYCELNIKPVYIHGKAKNADSCDLVLGTHSFVNNDKEKTFSIIPECFNVFKKHNQRHKYATIDPYQDFLRELTSKKTVKPVFHVIGHSLNETDHKI